MTVLKFRVDSLDGIDQTVQPMYSLNDADNKYYLQVEGVVSKEKLEEFRNNNISLSKKLEEYKDVDPSKYRELVKMEASGKFKGKSPEEVDQMINERVTTMRTEYETNLTTLQKDNEAKTAQLSLLLVDNVVRDAATKNNVTGPAIDDILLRAKTVFKLIDGVPTPHDEKGSIVYGKDGTTPMSVADWVGNLRKTAPHLFPGSSGGGAQGSRNAGAANNANLTANQKIAAGLASRTQ
jgi:hypothetical protein